MSMTRKDYEILADAFRASLMDAKYESAKYGVMEAAQEVARRIATANPNFNKPRFLIACGFDPESRVVKQG